MPKVEKRASPLHSHQTDCKLLHCGYARAAQLLPPPASPPPLTPLPPPPHLNSSCLFPIIMAFNAIRMVIRLQFRNTSMTQLCECGGERRAGRLPVWHLEGQSGCHQIWGGGWVRTRASNLCKPSSRPAIGC